MQTIIHKSAIKQTRGFALSLRCWWMKATDIPMWQSFSPINACILRILSYKLVNFKSRMKKSCMKNISAEVSIFSH